MKINEEEVKYTKANECAWYLANDEKVVNCGSYNAKFVKLKHKVPN